MKLTLEKASIIADKTLAKRRFEEIELSFDRLTPAEKRAKEIYGYSNRST